MDKIICDECGKEFEPGSTNGLPNGIGFELEDGKIINVCQSCLIKAGEGKGLKLFGKEGD